MERECVHSWLFSFGWCKSFWSKFVLSKIFECFINFYTLKNLYDILLNLLDERGMGEQFANEMAEFATAFEHSQYIGLLEKLQQFSK